MYNAPYAILHKSENATLQYFIFCKKVLDEKYLLKINNAFQQAIRRNSINLSLLTYALCSFLCLKLYSLNFAIAHAQNTLYAYHISSYLCCITRKQSYHLKQAQKSISNLSNL